MENLYKGTVSKYFYDDMCGDKHGKVGEAGIDIARALEEYKQPELRFVITLGSQKYRFVVEKEERRISDLMD